jgi:hypothetical protein
MSKLNLFHTGPERAIENQRQGKEDGIQRTSQEGVEQAQGSQVCTQEAPSRQDKGKRKAEDSPAPRPPSPESKVQRIAIPRKEDSVPLQEKVVGVNNISHITDIPNEVLSVLNKGVNFNLHKKSSADKFQQEFVSIQQQLVSHFGIYSKRQVAIFTNALKPALIIESQK